MGLDCRPDGLGCNRAARSPDCNPADEHPIALRVVPMRDAVYAVSARGRRPQYACRHAKTSRNSTQSLTLWPSMGATMLWDFSSQYA